jgi:uncharacterized secreted protein with C-terminal beta-propeller domain
MIKRWIAILIVLAVMTVGCSYSLAVPTPIAPQPSDTSAVPTVTVVVATQPSLATVTPLVPLATSTLPPAAPTMKMSTAAPVAPTAVPMRYALQPGTPVAVGGFVHTDLGCNWMGVGGQVFALDSTPVKQLVVELGGTLNGQPISQLGLTGAATQWGPGGYEFTLANHPIDSSGTLWLRVLDLNGNPISNRIYFTTYNDCSKNAVMINLVETATNVTNHAYLPYIGR